MAHLPEQRHTLEKRRPVEAALARLHRGTLRRAVLDDRRRNWNDLWPVGGVGREYSVVTHHMDAGRWDEGGELSEELRRWKRQVLAAVVERALEAVDDGAVRERTQ